MKNDLTTKLQAEHLQKRLLPLDGAGAHVRCVPEQISDADLLAMAAEHAQQVASAREQKANG
jgi:hypothetical protein